VAGNGTTGTAGSGAALETALNYPFGIALTGNDIYFTNSEGYRLMKLSGGALSTIAGDGTSDSTGDGALAIHAQINEPCGFAVGPDGSFYFTEQRGSKVRKIDTAGIISTIAASGLSIPHGLTVDAAGTVYVADTCNDRIVMIRDGVVSTVAGGNNQGTALNQLDFPYGAAIGPDSYLYVADTGNHRIMRY
jgi:DNA-binding beta-propeller fold protein YncE